MQVVDMEIMQCPIAEVAEVVPVLLVIMDKLAMETVE
jgi:hypothetical protein